MLTIGKQTNSPKLLVHVFIGSRLALLAEEGDKMSTKDRIINFGSMLAGGLVGLVVGWLIFRRTMRRAAEIAAEDALEAGLAIDDGGARGGEYADSDADDFSATTTAGRNAAAQRRPLMMDPDEAALVLDDDDISLWETESPAADAGRGDAYVDGFDEGDGDDPRAGSGKKARTNAANGKMGNGRS